MKKILLTFFILLISTLVNADVCLTNERALTFEVFNSKEEAIQFAKDNKISLNNIIREQNTNIYSVWTILPKSFFSCINFSQ